MEFLQYYKSNGYSVASFKEKSPFARKNRDDSTKAASFTIDGNLSEDKNSKSKSKKYDARGRPLPSHPKKSKLPPALKGWSDKSSTDSASDSDSDSSSNATPSSSHKFGAFLKRLPHMAQAVAPAPTKQGMSCPVVVQLLQKIKWLRSLIPLMQRLCRVWKM